jgi:23S rRNA (uracil1939-C5)-methyltransferase
VGRKAIKPFYSKIPIVEIGAEGKSIAKIDDLIVFTTYAIPGDIVDLQVTKNRKRYQEARVVHYHQYSPLRIDPVCSHFGICGGCKWQHLDYKNQLGFKQKQVKEQLSRIGHLALPEVFPILGSSQTTWYRNKLEFTFSNNRWLTEEELSSTEIISDKNTLGFHIPGLFDKVLPITKCWLQPEPSNYIRNFIFDYANKNGFDFFDIRKQTGFLRTLIIRTTSTGGVMVILSFFYDEPEKRSALLDAIKDEFPEITSLMYVINPKGNDTITDQNIILHKGEDHIWEEMEGLRFKIGPKSFYQTNSEQAYTLYKVVRDFAQPDREKIIYDLYTGTGTIANFIARSSKQVVGIEYIPEAIDDAKENASINEITNARFFAGDIKMVLTPQFIKENGEPDIIITDPPRAGMHQDVIKAILEIYPEKIVYVSCNPATQARDISLMSELYKIEKVQPVDMFPHTHHVENVVLLNKK